MGKDRNFLFAKTGPMSDAREKKKKPVSVDLPTGRALGIYPKREKKQNKKNQKQDQEAKEF